MIPFVAEDVPARRPFRRMRKREDGGRVRRGQPGLVRADRAGLQGPGLEGVQLT